MVMALTIPTRGISSPRDAYNLTQIERYIGDDVTLSCPNHSYQGNFSITWYKYNEPLQEVTYRDAINTRMLILSNLLLADGGRYTCVLKTESNRTLNTSYMLTINDHSQNKKPSIITHSINQTVIIGKTATFTCTITSFSTPYIEWFLHSTRYQNTAQANSNTSYFHTRSSLKRMRGIMTVREAGTGAGRPYEILLRVVNVTYRDSGWYSCRVFDKYGKAFKQGFLAVTQAPTLSQQDLQLQYTRRYADNPKVPLALLVSLPVGVLVIACAVLVRALERSKRANAQQTGSSKQPEEDSSAPSTRRNPVNHIPSNGVGTFCNHYPPSVAIGSHVNYHPASFGIVRENNNNRTSVNSYLQQDCEVGQQCHTLTSSQSASTPDVWPTTSSDQRDNRQRGQQPTSSGLHSSSDLNVTSPTNRLSVSSATLDMEWEGLDLKITESLELVKMPVEVDV
ncbi:predicted protein [Nematostella vectensis]|uniref:Soluble interferon alpha/beta receptor OPG204 n=1 Tax=Nematostella vectensis TaxID=45351 RepID=A7RZL9_NEMVE|nr:predicted protein [Nematostella vectensis]|eukprot:XP_001635183.1 predicted protein [Nematostella vectensis]